MQAYVKVTLQVIKPQDTKEREMVSWSLVKEFAHLETAYTWHKRVWDVIRAVFDIR